MKRLVSFLIFCIFLSCAFLARAQTHSNPRLIVLVAIDGLRPDMVSQRDMPHLYSLAHDGVRFDHHHSQFPTLTMVDAATLATGAPPGTTGILGDEVYLGSALLQRGANLQADSMNMFAKGPVDLENTALLAAANSAGGFNGYLLGLDTIGQEIEREGGFIAIVGKRGPSFLFDDRLDNVTDGRDILHQPHANYMFLSDDAAYPAALNDALKALPPNNKEGVLYRDRDKAFARFVADRTIPAAKDALEHGHPAMIVLWLHNADATQHRAGLGTLAAIQALFEADQDLMTVQAALTASGLDDRSDMIVVSDHGFATIRFRVSLAAMLVSAGLKKSIDSDEVMIGANGGSDLVYLSHEAFPTPEQKRDRLQKIVDFCEAQEWCGPIFSRELAIVAPAHGRAKRRTETPFRGWIDGTFAQSTIGVLSQSLSPDLIISFAEAPDVDNKGLTGPTNPAFSLGTKGQESVKNNSQELIRPVKGLVYSDTSNPGFTTGMGMHGAAGAREIHNFGAAIGPDFKRGYTDQNPTGNIDVAPTIAHLLGLQPNIGPGSISPSGRVMTEALKGESSYAGAARRLTMTTDLELQGVDAITTLKLTKLGDSLYLDDSAVDRKPLGNSP